MDHMHIPRPIGDLWICISHYKTTNSRHCYAFVVLQPWRLLHLGVNGSNERIFRYSYIPHCISYSWMQVWSHLHLFFTVIKKLLNASFTPVIVTDGEKAVINAIRNVFPSWTVISCWNHILTDAEVWLKHGILLYQKYRYTKALCMSYCSVVHPKSTLQSIRQPVLPGHLVLRVQCAYTSYLMSVNFPHSSVTNNLSESSNHILKRQEDWWEVSVDAIVMVLYRLQSYYQYIYIGLWLVDKNGNIFYSAL